MTLRGMRYADLLILANNEEKLLGVFGAFIMEMAKAGKLEGPRARERLIELGEIFAKVARHPFMCVSRIRLLMRIVSDLLDTAKGIQVLEGLSAAATEHGEPGKEKLPHALGNYHLLQVAAWASKPENAQVANAFFRYAAEYIESQGTLPAPPPAPRPPTA